MSRLSPSPTPERLSAVRNFEEVLGGFQGGHNPIMTQKLLKCEHILRNNDSRIISF